MFRRLGGASSRRPDELKQGLSSEARALVDRAFQGIDPTRLFDYHTHIAGVGAGGTGCFVNPGMRTPLYPVRWFKYKIYISASRVKRMENADQEIVLRLVDLVRNIPHHGRHNLLAFDKYYNPDGTVNERKTEFYVPNEYVFALAAEYPDVFSPAMSVHPYRADALDELSRWAGKGGRIVKWLPNSMGMDPADARCDGYYRRMKELGLILLVHAGEEQSVEAAEDQKWGNPLRLRRPLDHGVRVILAHCATLGKNEDLDSPARKRVHNFELFLRLMSEEKYRGLLFGEISATTQFNRIKHGLATLLERNDLHSRLVNGSDYPLPAINALIRTRSLVRAGLLTPEERGLLNEIYDYNPLLFDFVLKRCLKSGDSAFPPSVFMAHPHL
jgi:predicted TIM-barrel fold metal-dependent hydrolase